MSPPLAIRTRAPAPVWRSLARGATIRHLSGISTPSASTSFHAFLQPPAPRPLVRRPLAGAHLWAHPGRTEATRSGN
jgi:hypothetical protein